MTGTEVPIQEDAPKTWRGGSREFSGGCTFYLAAGGIRTTDAPNRYVPTSSIAENGCGRSTEYRDRSGEECVGMMLANATNGGE